MAFCDEVALPMVDRWRQARYQVAVPVLRSAQETYDSLRREMGLLNYQDLLLQAARLLREHPRVCRYFQG